MSITIVFATKGVWSTETGLNKAAADSRMYDREMIDTLESAFRFTPPGTAMTEPYMRAINQRIAARGAKPCTLDLFRVLPNQNHEIVRTTTGERVVITECAQPSPKNRCVFTAVAIATMGQWSTVSTLSDAEREARCFGPNLVRKVGTCRDQQELFKFITEKASIYGAVESLFLKLEVRYVEVGQEFKIEVRQSESGMSFYEVITFPGDTPQRSYVA